MCFAAGRIIQIETIEVISDAEMTPADAERLVTSYTGANEMNMYWKLIVFWLQDADVRSTAAASGNSITNSCDNISLCSSA